LKNNKSRTLFHVIARPWHNSLIQVAVEIGYFFLVLLLSLPSCYYMLENKLVACTLLSVRGTEEKQRGY